MPPDTVIKKGADASRNDNPKVLIVDDDANSLSGLRRVFRTLRPSWHISFAVGGPEAAEMIDQEAFDVVVSDMRMPQLDGGELLSRIQQHHPQTVRVILSGYAEQDCVLRAVTAAHQYVSKPSDAVTIAEIIERAMALRQMIGKTALRKLVGGLSNLPTPSPLYRRLNEEMDSPRASVASVTDIISSDVAMSAELLKLTNSSFFALAQKVTTPMQAVRILGFDTVKALVVRSSLFRTYADNSHIARMLQPLNDYSLNLASLARQLAKSQKLNTTMVEQSGAAAMMAQIGMLILLDGFTDRYTALLETSQSIDELAAKERTIFGVSHGEVGAYLLGLWGFCDPVVEAVAYSLTPSAVVAQSAGPLAMVHLARVLGPPLPLGRHPMTLQADEGFVERMGLTAVLSDWDGGAHEDAGGQD